MVSYELNNIKGLRRYFNKLNLNGWIRTSIISPEASEVMLVSKNVKDKIIRIN